MPIRFECENCSQRLSIARRKAGTEIHCPTCGQSQWVPEEVTDNNLSAPEGAAEEGEVSGHETVEEEPSEAEVLSAEEPGGAAAEPEEAAATTDFGTGGPAPLPPPLPEEIDLSKTIDLTYPPETGGERGEARPQPPPLPSRTEGKSFEPAAAQAIPWAVLVQAMLLLTVAVGGFSAGYYLGRQDASAPQVEAAKAAASEEPKPNDGFSEEQVLLEWRILWMPNPGKSEGDHGASFIALPQDRIPRDSLPIAGLQPGAETDSQASAAVIGDLGGAFERAAKDGSVLAVLPREGRYHLLLISNHALRPDDGPIRPRDLVEMKQYFAEPERLIGPRKYVWLSEEFRVGFPPKEHDFGLDGL